jgi:hypothetical protein
MKDYYITLRNDSGLSGTALASFLETTCRSRLSRISPGRYHRPMDAFNANPQKPSRASGACGVSPLSEINPRREEIISGRSRRSQS